MTHETETLETRHRDQMAVINTDDDTRTTDDIIQGLAYSIGIDAGDVRRFAESVAADIRRDESEKHAAEPGVVEAYVEHTQKRLHRMGLQMIKCPRQSAGVVLDILKKEEE